MVNVDIVNDLDEAKGLWLRHWPRMGLFDLWPVRACFQSQYNHTPHFLVATAGRRFCGMLALSWIDEQGGYGHFPGELWQGKTWLEQNRLVAADGPTAQALLAHIPPGSHLRYLEAGEHLDPDSRITLDETGYLFFPPRYDFALDNYWQSFPGKSRKKIRTEINALATRGMHFRHDHVSDLDALFRLNLANYKQYSYFTDARFLRAFENLASWLRSNRMLRITTLMIGDTVAAVDLGALWNNTYTLLAGGTDPNYPGVAKAINLHHLEWACAQRLAMVDFLCGDFNWKQRFRLTARALYQLRQPHIARPAAPAWSQRAAIVA